jgi:asparagine synthase (glutamine-hydrolysing)
MWHSVELRVPFLDKDLMKFVFSIDEKIKFRDNIPKSLLKDAFNDIIPYEIIQRPKMGFTFPFQEWMRNNLKTLTDFIPNSKSKHIERIIKRFSQGNLHWSRIWALAVMGKGKNLWKSFSYSLNSLKAQAESRSSTTSL